jgi:hypothetical protein
MRLFIKYKKSGAILSVSKVDIFPRIYETPFGILEKGEYAAEFELTKELEKLECGEIHMDYSVDIKVKTLIKK